MAFDGITVRALTKELSEKLVGGRITKVVQPEKDEILLTIKSNDTYRLFMSANASLPLVYLVEDNKQAPITAPAFCMLLRKHFNSARILSIKQGTPGQESMERALVITVEHLDEMGDLKIKHLIMEIMGKHSNIILCDDDLNILDSIKRVSSFMSSVREVLPGRKYFLPETQKKDEPLGVNQEDFINIIKAGNNQLAKSIYMGFTGLSPSTANEICIRAGISADTYAEAISEDYFIHLYKTFMRMMEEVQEGTFFPEVMYKNEEPIEYSMVKSELFENDTSATIKQYTSVSELLHDFYSEKNESTVIRQKSADLRRIVGTAIEREAKKLQLQQKQLEDTEKREKYRVYGELITAYGYSVQQGAKSMTALNYYTNEEEVIPLESDIAPIENAKRYFDKYAKLKRTFEAQSKNVEETKATLEHLNSIKLSLDIALTEEDLNQIKAELTDFGYMKYKPKKDKFAHRMSKQGYKAKGQKIKSAPLHFVSPEGIHFYVGKNNTQNDELTFGFANGADWWFHAKGCPGSHVIMKVGGLGIDIPDIAFEDAGALAAYYSSADRNGKVEVDYVQKKEVKKPSGGKPGFVVYYTNNSLIAIPDIKRLTLMESI